MRVSSFRTAFAAIRRAGLLEAGRRPVSVLEQGADPLGIDDSTEAFIRARLLNGGSLRGLSVPPGAYRFGDEVLPLDRVGDL